MEHTLSLAEAAEATGLTRKALQRRIDRGSLRSVLSGGLRRIPVDELQRAGLLGAATGVGPAPAPALGDLLDRLERQAEELGALRALVAQAGVLEGRLEAERRARQGAEAALAALRARVDELEVERGAAGLGPRVRRAAVRVRAGAEAVRRVAPGRPEGNGAA